jgi:hypothetical protein
MGKSETYRKAFENFGESIAANSIRDLKLGVGSRREDSSFLHTAVYPVRQGEGGYYEGKEDDNGVQIHLELMQVRVA